MNRALAFTSSHSKRDVVALHRGKRQNIKEGGRA